MDKRGRGGRVKREGGGKEGGKELLERGEGVTFFGFVVFPAKQVGVFVRFEVAEADNDRFRVERRGAIMATPCASVDTKNSRGSS
jgi:hypothetical protein